MFRLLKEVALEPCLSWDKKYFHFTSSNEASFENESSFSGIEFNKFDSLIIVYVSLKIHVV